MERVHFQVGVGVFNCQQILKQRFLSLSLMLWYETNRMWLSVVCILSTTIQVITVDEICCETNDLFMHVDTSKIFTGI